MLPLNDPDVIRQHYETDENLRIHQETHDLYSVPKVDFPDWVCGLVPWHGDETILDIGCGPGSYFETLRSYVPDMKYVGVDRSPGMLKKHPASSGLLVGDIQNLPFADHSFDVVMANHMMYHVPDIEKALTECHRVLKPDGFLATATNSIHTMPELLVLLRRAIVLLSPTGGATIQPPSPVHHLFALENGSQYLTRYFYAVVRHDLPSQLVFPSPEPVMAYLETLRPFHEPQLPDGVLWDDVILIMRQQITHLVNHFGELVISKVSGVLMASDRGGFIREYTDYLERSGG